MSKTTTPTAWRMPLDSLRPDCSCGGKTWIFLPLTRVLIYLCSRCGAVAEKSERKE